MSIEAMKQALEALDAYSWEQVDSARAALRQAIEQAEKQEPVAWIEHEWSGTGLRHLHFERHEASLRDEVVNPIWTPLYTTPQPQQEPVAWQDTRKTWVDVPLKNVLKEKREWDGLTDEDIEQSYEKTGHYQTLRPQDRFAVFALARAIEAKFKEKNT